MINQMSAIDLNNILFLDIETVSCMEGYHLMAPRLQLLWNKKALLINRDENITSEELYLKKAAIYAEFGKVVAVAVGYIRNDKAGSPQLRVKAFASENESDILESFKELVNKFDKDKLVLCAHNGKEFDFPYLCRRMVLNAIQLPAILDISGRKPWEVHHFDTMEMWKFGDKKNYTSLDLLAAIFGIESSKDDIDGSMVNQVYYEDKDLPRIAKYCMHDVIVTAQLFLKLNCFPAIPSEQIIMIS
jgi:3'-5' exonuclease